MPFHLCPIAQVYKLSNNFFLTNHKLHILVEWPQALKFVFCFIVFIVHVAYFIKILFCYFTGGLDNTVKLWDVTKVIKEVDKDMDASIPSSLTVYVVVLSCVQAHTIMSILFTENNFTKKDL